MHQNIASLASLGFRIVYTLHLNNTTQCLFLAYGAPLKQRNVTSCRKAVLSLIPKLSNTDAVV